MEVQPQSPKPELLTLPLEIRRMIYHFIQEARCIPPPSSQTRPPHHLAGTHICRYYTRDDSGRSRYSPYEHLTLSGLRATNKQLYHETLEFATYPKLSLQIVDTLELKNWFSPEVQALTGDSFARENIVTVQLHLALNGKYLYQNDPLRIREPKETNASRRPTLFSKFWTNLVVKPENVINPQQPFSLKPFVELFDACPNLTFVTIISDYTYFFDIWEDPRGDVEAFESLIKRGVKVELHQGDTRNGWLAASLSFSRLMKSMSKDLENGTQGKVFLSRLCGSDIAVFKTLDQSAEMQDHTLGTVFRDKLGRRTIDFQ